MRHIKLFEQFINELFTHKEGNNLNNKHFVLHKKDLWIFDETEYQNIYNDISDECDYDMYNSLIYLSSNPSYVVGHIKNNVAYIESDYYRHSDHSPDLFKLQKELNIPIKSLYYDENDEKQLVDIKPNKEELKNRIFYHGTCKKFLDSILKNGLTPNNFSNYSKINFNDKVFITLNIEKAEYHAKLSADKNDSEPIIISLKIPDVSKLIIDFDLAVDIYGDDSDISKKYGYNEINKYANKNKGIGYEGDITNKVGIYAYVGRIPSSFIVGVD